MKPTTFVLLVLIMTFGVPGTASANCADDAIDTCNAKHPDPNKSDSAYDLYELCIKAQLGQKCPNNAAENNKILAGVKNDGKGHAPKCNRGFSLVKDFKSDGSDWCMKAKPKKAAVRLSR
jgi:hypothetical protein